MLEMSKTSTHPEVHWMVGHGRTEHFVLDEGCKCRMGRLVEAVFVPAHPCVMLSFSSFGQLANPFWGKTSISVDGFDIFGKTSKHQADLFFFLSMAADVGAQCVLGMASASNWC